MTFGFFADEPIVATEDERAELAGALEILDRHRADRDGARPRLVGAGGEEVELPETALALLRELTQHLAAGDAVMLVPVHRQLTTQQAADLLNVSRPYFIQLLERGEIPYTKTGSHRRIRFDDLMAYKRVQAARRREALQELTRLSQELGLYDMPVHAER